ncbi:hypothetical protein M569_10772, partial [Genlisea aurea]
AKKLTLIPLMFMIYFEVSGGPYSEEPTVLAAGPLFAILGFFFFIILYCIPSALITAELSTAYPGNGGFIVWADHAFGPFFGSLMGSWRYLSGIITMAAYPAQCIGYLINSFPIFSSGWPRYFAIFVFVMISGILNYIGIAIVSYVVVGLAIIAVSPIITLWFASIPKLRPHRWISLGQKGVKKDWNLYINTLLWNLNNWDAISTMAGEVEKPKKIIPLALFVTVILVGLTYVVTIVAATGGVVLDQSEWQAGFLAGAGGIIAGDWLKIWIQIGAIFSSLGLFGAQLSSCCYQLVGMSDLALLPRVFSVRSKWFNTPWLSILVSISIGLGLAYINYTSVVSSANFVTSLGMLLEFASFLWLRWKKPEKPRPYKLPLRLPALVVMLLFPVGILCFLLVTSSKVVYMISGVMTAAGIGFFLMMKLFRLRGWLGF